MFAFCRISIQKIVTLMACGILAISGVAQARDMIQPDPAYLIQGGERDARMIQPDLIEIRIAGRKETKEGPLRFLEAFQGAERPQVPLATDFEVRANGAVVPVKEVGYRQEVYFAAFKGYDIRVLGSVYLRLEKGVDPGAKIEVIPKKDFWAGREAMVFEAGPDEWTPAIQVKQTGYQSDLPKRARVGLYLGSLGETHCENLPFELVDTQGKVVFQGALERTKDEGWGTGDCKDVMLADFSTFQTPGTYRLRVAGMGSSKPFHIGNDALAYALRLYALGMYHQRCGEENALPFTRHTHAACHTAPAEIPTTEERFKNTNKHILDMTGQNYKADKHPAPRMTDVAASLYPILKNGTVDVHGGHHDAGDYSKYVTNGAAFVHSLATAVDSFAPPTTNWDALGLPESSDGIPDPLQEAMWEADYLVKMQDEDGGFFFIVYPLNRKYEGDVLPENGDSQVVFPKNMIATAAVTGALAELGSSPTLIKNAPKVAERYMAAAKKGYAFLRAAIAKYGLEGSHQVISHYGGLYDHMDELAYAAAAMFAATGDKSFENDLKTWWPDPTSNTTRRWGWWHLFEGYGAAARVYGLAEHSGRPGGKSADPEYLAKIREELILGGKAQIMRAAQCAYGIPVPVESKRFRGIGWFWAMDSAMDIASAAILDPTLKDQAIQVLSDCSAYEFGGNPVNRPLVSGSGDRWMREIVHQYAHNDARVLPPSGIPFGNVFGGPHHLEQYKVEGRNGLNLLYSPNLGEPFPFYNRVAADAFNVSAEFTVSQQARNFAAYAYLLGATQTGFPEGKILKGSISGVPDRVAAGTPLKATITGENLPPLSEAQILWESSGNEPASGAEYQAVAAEGFPGFVEVEAVWPDGRRLMASHPLKVSQANAEAPSVKSSQTIALVSFDDLPLGEVKSGEMVIQGQPRIVDDNVSWSTSLTGHSAFFPTLESQIDIPLPVSIPDSGITVSVWIHPEKFSIGTDSREVIGIYQNGKRITALRTPKWPKGNRPDAINAKGDIFIGSEDFAPIQTKTWQKITIDVAPDGSVAYAVNGKRLGAGKSAIDPAGNLLIRVGGFRGWADDLNVVASPTPLNLGMN